MLLEGKAYAERKEYTRNPDRPSRGMRKRKDHTMYVILPIILILSIHYRALGEMGSQARQRMNMNRTAYFEVLEDPYALMHK